MAGSAYEMTLVPRNAVRWPLSIPVPAGFDPERPETWPDIPGRLEYVGGRLLYMPPCGDDQQLVTTDVVTDLNLWRRKHREFVVGGNEAGMVLGGDTRGADAAIWRRSDHGPNTGGFPRVPPILAVEICGKDEGPDDLLEKARWYLDHRVELVWIIVPETRSALVVTERGTTEVGPDESMPSHPSLPGLEPRVASFFQQLTK